MSSSGAVKRRSGTARRLINMAQDVNVFHIGGEQHGEGK